MMNTTSPMISFLITHYNRSHDLLLCLNAISALDLSNYQEETSGRYGETEYAIRILKSAAKIGITKQAYATTIEGSQSVLANESGAVTKSFSFNKKAMQWVRAFRLYAELILYDKKTAV
jgi:hypothetical protein